MPAGVQSVTEAVGPGEKEVPNAAQPRILDILIQGREWRGREQLVVRGGGVAVAGVARGRRGAVEAGGGLATESSVRVIRRNVPLPDSERKKEFRDHFLCPRLF